MLNLFYLLVLLFNLIHCNQLNTPVVLWHGMGDDCCNSDSMGKIIKLIQKEIPNTFVHSIQLSDNLSDDREAGFLGNLNKQIDQVCSTLKKIPELQNGFNALGFSQGGLFLRAYMEKCQFPPIKKLITFGSPHAGIASAPGCDSGKPSASCRWMRFMLQKGAYSYYVRDHVIQAQYFKDPLQLGNYYKYNIFLPDINNELRIRNHSYSSSLKKLEKLVLIKFTKDQMIVPRESAWFGFIKGRNFSNIQHMRETPGYLGDWIGLKTLDNQKKIDFLTINQNHMAIPEEFLINQIIPYLKPNDDQIGNLPIAKKIRQKIFKFNTLN